MITAFSKFNSTLVYMMGSLCHRFSGFNEIFDIKNRLKVFCHMQNIALNTVVPINDVTTKYVKAMHAAIFRPSFNGSLVLANTQPKQDTKGTINKKNVTAISIGIGLYYLKMLCGKRCCLNVSRSGINLKGEINE